MCDLYHVNINKNHQFNFFHINSITTLLLSLLLINFLINKYHRVLSHYFNINFTYRKDVS